LGNVEKIPSTNEATEYRDSEQFSALLKSLTINLDHFKANQHIIAKHLLDEGKVMEAWKILILN